MTKHGKTEEAEVKAGPISVRGPVGWVTRIVIVGGVILLVGLAFWTGRNSMKDGSTSLASSALSSAITCTSLPTYTPYPTNTPCPTCTPPPTMSNCTNFPEDTNWATLGLMNGCISTKIWSPYTAVEGREFPKKGQCWNLASEGFDSEGETLVISADQNIVRSAAAIGTWVRPGAQVSVNLEVSLLSTAVDRNPVMIGIGVIPWNEKVDADFLYPTQSSSNLYVLAYSDSTKGPLQVRYGASVFAPDLALFKSLRRETPLEINIDFQEGRFVVTVDKVLLGSYTTASSDYRLWIGYYRKSFNTSSIMAKAQISVKKK